MEEDKKDSEWTALLSHRAEEQYSRSGKDELRSSDAADAVEGLVHGLSMKRSRLVNTRPDSSLVKEFEGPVRELTVELQNRAEQLRSLASELTQTEIRGRRRLALILHDDLQQWLFYTKLTVYSVLMDLEKSEVRNSLKKVEALLNQSIDKCRMLTGEISPPVLCQGSLEDALRWLAHWMNEKYGLAVTLRIDENIETMQDVRALLSLAVRELLFNIVKHADAKRSAVCVGQSSSDDPSIASLMDAIRSCVHPGLKVQ